MSMIRKFLAPVPVRTIQLIVEFSPGFDEAETTGSGTIAYITGHSIRA